MLNQFVNSVVDAGRGWLQGSKTEEGAEQKDIETLCFELLQVKGESTSAALAFDIVNSYRSLDDQARSKFIDGLASHFDLDIDALIKYAQAYKEEKTSENLRNLMQKSEALRQTLFRRINQAQEGTAMLVNLREEVLLHLKTRPDWARIDLDLKHLLSSWFNRGFLQVQRIDWHSSAIILEKLIRYESVHSINGWDDLRRRLAEDRRCYAFFHPVLRDEPLIFVEIALVKGLASSIGNILDTDGEILPPNQADTAIFYSINNCQKGLRGISFGDFLIKQVVSEIQKEIPNIKTFATLSPIPGFRCWLSDQINNAEQSVIDPADRELLAEIEKPQWMLNRALSTQLKPILSKLCAYYLVKAKRGDKPYDPVARFHLHNGAQVNQINWLGDKSRNGIKQSYGFLVNYLYDPKMIECNHEDYVHHEKVAASDSVLKLIKTVNNK